VSLNNSKFSVLLFCPKFFNYEFHIKSELENLGADVTFYDERPGNNVRDKLLLRINPRLVQKKINNYYKGILTHLATYDYVLVVNREAMPTWFLKELRDRNKTAKMILYMWDSLSNKKLGSKDLGFFNESYTFDWNDSVNIKEFSFLPLFYINQYAEISNDQRNLKYDLSFVGSVHGKRYELISKLLKNTNIDLERVFVYLYMPSKWMFYFRKLFVSEFRLAKYDEFNFESLPLETLLNVIRNSRIIIDIQNPNQSGLTMRTIEMIGAQKKIVTTNKSIVNYDFFHENNIYVLDHDNLEIPADFIDSDYYILPDYIYQKYSLKSWLTQLIGTESKIS
jgi:hypothetical protein